MPVLVRSRLRATHVRVSAVERVLEHILSRLGCHNDLLSVEFIGDGKMQRLNHRYRQVDRTTDVLAFATREAGGPSSPLLGDLVISVPQAARQACHHRHSVSQEIVILLVHGVLHLLGYDHERGEAEACLMRRKEQQLLREVVPAPRLVAPDRRSRRTPAHRRDLGHRRERVARSGRFGV